MTYLALTAILALSVAAAVLEARYDREGEREDGKIEDAVALFLFTVVLCWGVWVLFDIMPWKVVPLVLGVRILIFDYYVTYLLIKEKVIVGHWFTYTGQTAKWDRLISKINPWVRLAIRIVIFSLSILLFLWQ